MYNNYLEFYTQFLKSVTKENEDVSGEFTITYLAFENAVNSILKSKISEITSIAAIEVKKRMAENNDISTKSINLEWLSNKAKEIIKLSELMNSSLDCKTGHLDIAIMAGLKDAITEFQSIDLPNCQDNINPKIEERDLLFESYSAILKASDIIRELIHISRPGLLQESKESIDITMSNSGTFLRNLLRVSNKLKIYIDSYETGL